MVKPLARFNHRFRRIGRRLRGHGEDALHEHPVAWEGAEVGVSAGFCRSGELDGACLSWLEEFGVVEHVWGIWDVVFGHGLWVGEHGVGQCADFLQGAGFDDEEVVRQRGAAGVFEGDFDFFAGFDGQRFLVEHHGVGWVRFEGDFLGGFLCGEEAGEATNGDCCDE